MSSSPGPSTSPGLLPAKVLTSGARFSDPAVKQILLQLDENAGRQRLIISDLDETHVLIAPASVERVRQVRRPLSSWSGWSQHLRRIAHNLQELEDALEANHWNPLAVEEQ